MAAPTKVSDSSSGWTTTGATRSTGSLTWQTGDLMLIVGFTENTGTTLSTPTGLTGLTLAALTGYPATLAGSAPIYAWSATASSGSSGTPSTNVSSSTNAAGIHAFVFRGHNGIGAVPTPVQSGTSLVLPTTRTGQHSLVVAIVVDGNATNDTTVTTLPSAGATQDDAAFMTGRATSFSFDWSDQGGPGTTSYGIDSATFTTTGPVSCGVVEITGFGDAGPRLLVGASPAAVRASAW